MFKKLKIQKKSNYFVDDPQGLCCKVMIYQLVTSYICLQQNTINPVSYIAYWPFHPTYLKSAGKHGSENGGPNLSIGLCMDAWKTC